LGTQSTFIQTFCSHRNLFGRLRTFGETGSMMAEGAAPELHEFGQKSGSLVFAPSHTMLNSHLFRKF